MAPIQAYCREELLGGGAGAVFLPDLHDPAAQRFAGAVQLAIVDRPAALKSQFLWKAGADDWLTAASSLRLMIHHNRSDGLEEYLGLLRRDLTRARELLSGNGAVYVFADQRASAHVRLLLDDVFGRTGFLNEIIWAHEAGLKPAGRFTRSHDTIFLYRRGRQSVFNAGAAGRARGRLKSHMRRSEEGGRAYYTRQSGGRVYRYFEDDVVSVGDVWSDISAIAAKDDERLGWEGQRPEALLERMIAVSSEPGGLVLDVCSGAGTVAAVAQRLGRRAVLCGASPAERLLARRRLLLAGAEAYEFVGCGAGGAVQANAGLAGGEALLNSFARPGGEPVRRSTLLDDGLGSLEYWAAGRVREGTFHAHAWAMRTRQSPTLPRALPVGEGAGQPAVHLVDAGGEQWFFLID